MNDEPIDLVAIMAVFAREDVPERLKERFGVHLTRLGSYLRVRKADDPEYWEDCKEATAHRLATIRRLLAEVP